MEIFDGRVLRLLRDDLEGDRHQRFILELLEGRTILIAHNIDVAPRIEGLYEGASVTVFGEYEWNELGGLVHWTHKDPKLEREGGWVEFKGVRFQ